MMNMGNGVAIYAGASDNTIGGSRAGAATSSRATAITGS